MTGLGRTKSNTMDRESILVEVRLLETEKGVFTGMREPLMVQMDAALPLRNSVIHLLPEHIDHADLKLYIEADEPQEVEFSLKPKDSKYFCTVAHPVLFIHITQPALSDGTSRPNSQDTLPPSPSLEHSLHLQLHTTSSKVEEETSVRTGDVLISNDGHGDDEILQKRPVQRPRRQHTLPPQYRISLSHFPSQLEEALSGDEKSLWAPSSPHLGVQPQKPVLSKSENVSSIDDVDQGRLRCRGCQVQRQQSIDVKKFSSAQIINAVTDANFIININILWTIEDLKKNIASELGLSGDFDLTYKLDGREFQLFDPRQILHSSYLYHLWRQSGTTDIPITVRPSCLPPQEDRLALKRTSLITGVKLDKSTHGGVSNLQCISDGDISEVEFARRVLYSFVQGVVHQRDANAYSLSVEHESRSATTVLALKIPSDLYIEVNFHWRQSFTLTKKVNVRSSADAVLKDVFPCLTACKLVDESCLVEDYTLTVTGETSYISGTTELIVFKSIRRCIFKGEPIHLSVVKRPSLTLDQPLELSWMPVDPHTGMVTIDRQSMEEINTRCVSSPVLYLPMITSNFKITIIKAQNLLHCPLVSVKVTLYHGHTLLCTSASSEPVPVEDQGWAVWNEGLQLDILVNHIPRNAKLMISIYSHTRADDKAPCCLYWGLLNIIDYRGELVQGKVVRRLWRNTLPKLSGGYDFNPLAPSSNNPHSTAAEVTFVMEQFARPVFCPYLNRSKTRFKDVTRLLNERQLKGFPGYVAGIKWNVPDMVDELYYVLGYLDQPKKIAEFPIEQALKLLDCEYSDEQVRSFATLVLEKLPDDQLEDILLQLTQALKFEFNHASSLARFLLKRALENKRIGHFFFWYLRCELYNPQHVPRYATILEAYLLGCGESMMAGFEAQLIMQESIESMATELKERYKSDPIKMQEALPQALKSIEAAQFAFTSPYNPRVKLGNLQIEKCKIMGSKARPIWLEMRNMDENTLTTTPIRLILKMRDDLRQDMITLRMFSLFETLWEEEGLELQLIPYGCIATGPNGGFIEVVKNSKTIADVSGVKDDKKLFEWIRSHQKNEYGEIDEDKVKAAVQRFISSCAGYSVATYILGIGDRHNDNIMVTTSGVLFHIDFGHFLGNIKYCMGIKREWVPFVLTPDFVYVMGGEGSKTFEFYKTLCCKGFLKLRRHAHLIMNLFSMMRSTGMPELRCVQDLDHVHKALAITAETEAEAQDRFLEVIKKCLDLKWTVQVMWKIHNMAKKS